MYSTDEINAALADAQADNRLDIVAAKVRELLRTVAAEAAHEAKDPDPVRTLNKIMPLLSQAMEGVKLVQQIIDHNGKPPLTSPNEPA